MGTLNLGFDAITGSKGKRHFYNGYGSVIAIGKMHNAQYAVDVAAKKVVAVISKDREVRKAVAILKQTKTTIKAYGASESIMSFFNIGDQLAGALGIEIPEITSINASAVGIACCESIDEKVCAAYDLVKKFFDELVSTVAVFFEELQEVTASQKETLEELSQGLLSDIETIDAESFAKKDVFGFAHKVFVARLEALNGIVDKLGTCDIDADTIAEFEPLLAELGYKVREENEIEEETPAEAVSEAPAKEEVLETKHEEAVSTESVTEDGEIVSAPIEEPADVAQEKSMAVFGWNPATIRDSISGMCELLGKVEGLRPVEAKITELKNKAFAAIDAECTTEEAPVVETPLTEEAPVAPDTTEQEIPTIAPEASTEELSGSLAIENYRICAGFFGSAITLFQKNVSEMVNQLVTLIGSLKECEVEKTAPEAVPVEQVTTEEPTGPEVEETPAPAENNGEIVEPDNVPDTEPIAPDEADDETLPEPVGGAEHTEETETPPEDQPETDLPGEEQEPAKNFWSF